MHTWEVMMMDEIVMFVGAADSDSCYLHLLGCEGELANVEGFELMVGLKPWESENIEEAKWKQKDDRGICSWQEGYKKL